MARSRSRERSRRSRSKERTKKRNHSKERLRKSRSKERSKKRSHSRERLKRSRSKERRRSREPTKLKRSRKEKVNLESIQSVGELEMQKLMGFGNFDTTKNKKVADNVDGMAKINKPRKYRQYMNRKGGFNRPLDFVA